MSALALVFSRDRSPETANEISPMMAALEHQGRDGGRVETRTGLFSLGYQRTWTTPEEVGEEQPVISHSGGLTVAFHGRLDNRDELRGVLSSHWPAREGRPPSDAAVVGAAWERWEADALPRFVGPFAVVVVDHRQRQVFLARDPLGERTLVYRLDPARVVVASEEVAVLAHAAVSDNVSDEAVAAFLAVRAPQPGTTFFRDVSEIMPGTVLVVGESEVRTHRFWLPSTEQLRLRRDSDYLELFRNTLNGAVKAAMRSRGRCGVLMSGGMDSTSVAGLAAAHAEKPVPAFSWVFSDFPESDERPYMEAMSNHAHLEWHPIEADDQWPLKAGVPLRTNPNAPFNSPYRTIFERTFEECRNQRVDTLLTGEFGDHLFVGGEFGLVDAIRNRRWVLSARWLPADAWHHGIRGVRRHHSLRAAVGRVVGRRPRPAVRPRWLTEYASRLAPTSSERRGSLAHEQFVRSRVAVDPLTAILARLQPCIDAVTRVEARHPMRNRKLVELVMALPSHLLGRPGWNKWILRQSMVDVLPERVRLRRWRSSMLPLVRRGLVDEEAQRVRDLFWSESAIWSRFVRREWLRRVFPREFSIESDGHKTLIPWLCVCIELWNKSLRDSRPWGTITPAGGES